MYNPQLDTFIRVAEVGSFNRAAEELFVSTTAVIKQINLLERDLDVKLFVRTHRGLALTEAGKSLYGDARHIIQYSREAVVRAKNAMQTGENVIRIGTSPMTPGQFLLELWPRIQERCPDVKFQLVPFENTPENSVNILRNLGWKIDLVAGLFDEAFLKERRYAGLELAKAPIRCAMSIYHPLAQKSRLSVQDLYGENFMLIRRGWNRYLDVLRDDLWKLHPQINIVDFEMFNLSVFNRCQNSSDILMTVDVWDGVHPLLKTVPVDWDYTIPFGLLHSPAPTPPVQRFLEAVKAAYC